MGDYSIDAVDEPTAVVTDKDRALDEQELDDERNPGYNGTSSTVDFEVSELIAQMNDGGD